MKALLEPWGFMRILRLFMGGIILYQSFMNHQPLIGLLGGFFVLQVLLNTGCGAGRCSPKIGKMKEDSRVDEIDYEEVK